LQPTDGPLDPTVAGRLTVKLRYAKTLGLRTLLTIANAPDWASGGPGRSDDPPTAEKLPAYGAFVSELARTRGSLIDAYVPWNEPNLTYFWKPVDPVAYARLQRVAYDAVKRVDPTAIVLSGSIAGGHESAYSFLERAYRSGLRGRVTSSPGTPTRRRARGLERRGPSALILARRPAATARAARAPRPGSADLDHRARLEHLH